MASWFGKWLQPARTPGADRAYIALVAQARNSFFYTELAVPDTLDGRFEMIVLHLFLLQHRLLAAPEQQEFARQVSEVFFDDMDRSIRELGVADTGVGKRIKRMGKAYHGRLQAYEAGLNDAQALRAALARNLYGTLDEGDVLVLDRMGGYIRAQLAALDAADTGLIISGDYIWPAVRC